MKIRRFLQVLHARRKVILLTLLVTTLTAFVVSLAQPKVYKSTASLVISYRGADSASGAGIPAQVIQGYIATQVDILGSKNVALKVVDILKLDQGTEVKEQFQKATGGEGSIRDWLADLLLKNLEVRPAKDSSVIDITFKATDPKFAASVANAFATSYQGAGMQLAAEPTAKTSGIFGDQTKKLKRNLEEAQKKLYKFQQDKGIVSADGRMDVETNRLNELSSQLVAVQSQVLEATSRRGGAQGAGDSPDVIGNPLVQNLKAELARAEARFSQSTQGLGPNHPQYRSAQAEVNRLKAELNAQIAAVSHGVSNNIRSLQQRETELRTAYNQQKTRVLELNQARNELALLARDVENAQRAYDTATQRLAKTSVEGQIGQADVALLNEAVPALAPSGPQVMRNTLLAALLGAILGIVIGWLAEMADRRVRTAEDLADVLEAPVLGVIGWDRGKEDKFQAPLLGMQQRPMLPF
ncbi:chain length determinant protein EpsF [Paucimonas lemoignei]|uniref:Chain length determinant protein EpsF n=1 Tax=Paucimonas lemoignei TaxID=29443 RepID=A0A4R3I2L9_PAULE|nr:chain length determinant protein EpsF [Paucimonas lemoignei]TCS39263.1 chain length determinant protein EpsF [Paucimonas lemoignei]